ncbi:MAG: translation initiation factor [Bacteroidota bacterium]|jgi:translation initiation factor IF-2
MAEAEKTIRLSKAIKEFNLSMDHIVDFLSKKGFQIESNPNTKLPGDAYALLQKEFQGDKILKEEAQQLTQTKLKREGQVVVDAGVTKKSTSKKDSETPEILIKGVTVADFLGAEKKKKKSDEPAAAETAEPASEETKPKTTRKKSDEVIKAKAEKVDGPKVLGKIEIEGAEAKTEKKKGGRKKKETTEETPVTPVESPVAETPVEAPAPAPAPAPAAPEAPEEKDIHRVQIEKLSGPNILGKIELPVEDRRKPVASSGSGADAGEKKKRKRTDRKAGAQPLPQERGRGVGSTGRAPKNVASTDRKELTDKEIQEKIKATLARLSGGGKSKSSKIRKQRREERAEELEQLAAEESGKKVIKVTEFVTANELAKLMDVSVTRIISTCMSLGMFVSINQRLDAETLSVVAEEFGFTVEFVSAEVQETISAEEDRPEDLIARSPIVTVMGHVDHGKTSLLDYIRKANVIAGEAGGITQHIGAYNVELENGKHITFLDTPGHEAFTAMRARGAKVTDIAIIVIAADDSVMPQTVEAINHAQAAGVPMVFAINKVDKPDAQPERIKEQLAKMNILVEDWGGKFQCQEISAKKGMNVEQLLEKVLLEAELLELKANPDRRANGTVIESSLDKGRGYIMTVLVQGGTLKVGDVLIAGCYSGRVKALYNERGFRIKEAGPTMPAQVLGMNGAPQAGDLFNVMDDEREAREVANKRLQLQREQGIRTRKHITLDEIGRRLAIGNFKELNVIVKGDVDGSIEALADSLLKLSTNEVQVNIIHKSVGQITESDVLLASASNAIIIGFQVRPSVNARKLAETEEIEIRLYSIIYNAIEELKQAMEGLLAPEFQEKIVGNIEIRETFKIPKVGTIAGCMVLDGKINRNTKVRVVRDGIVVYSGELGSLKRFKDDVKEVSSGYECGLSIQNFNDIQIGDIIEGYEQVAVKRTLA